MPDIKVSIVCNTYNHENYIADALESFLMQKTDFDYEILIHDDASTDKTQDIIKKYEVKFPGIIKPIYQTENQYSQFGRLIINKTQYTRARGKYIAICEGDDFWLSADKLQKQVEHMENNPECVMYINAAKTVDAKNIEVGELKPFAKSGYCSIQQYFGKLSNIPTASILTTKEHMKKLLMTKYNSVSPVGDIPLHLYMFDNGSVYYNDEAMCAYRVNNPNSWVGVNSSRYNEHLQEMIAFFKVFNEETAKKYDDLISQKIKKMQFKIHLLECNLRKLKGKEYSDMYKNVSMLNKLKLYARYYFPFIIKLRTIILKYKKV